MKRFLLITMAIIITTLMLATTAFAADDSIRMGYDDNSIKLIAEENGTAILNITLQIGNTLEEITKEVNLQEKITTTVNVEDFVFEEFSDWYKGEEIKISTVDVSFTPATAQENLKTLKKGTIIALIVGIGIIILSFILYLFTSIHITTAENISIAGLVIAAIVMIITVGVIIT